MTGCLYSRCFLFYAQHTCLFEDLVCVLLFCSTMLLIDLARCFWSHGVVALTCNGVHVCFLWRKLLFFAPVLDVLPKQFVFYWLELFPELAWVGFYCVMAVIVCLLAGGTGGFFDNDSIADWCSKTYQTTLSSV